jgi:2-polyprenyl-6-methoxyphenol hydroxylase-like FAD-dependent oxidoreductase
MTVDSSGKGARILVVGAGPTGLTLALTLGAFGVKCTIIDQKPGPSEDSKGLALNTASLYGLELIGRRRSVGHKGRNIERVNLHWNRHRLCSIKLRHLNFHIQTVVTQPQSQTERELCEELGQIGIAVDWNTKLEAVHDHKEGVHAILQTADRTEISKVFNFVVGCDGKHSRVRRHLGASFVGNDYPMYFALGDFELCEERDDRQIDYFVFDDTFFVFVPIGGKRWRVVVKHEGALAEGRKIQAQDILQPIEQHFGKNVLVAKPHWLSGAQFYMRVADKLRGGRLFIAGDAAHLVSPIGGTGMNMGIQDAINLGWKLAFYVNGYGGEELLDSYQGERLTAIRNTCAISDQSTQLIAQKEANSQLTNVFLPRLANRRLWKAVLPVRHSGLGMSYSEAFQDGKRFGTPVEGSRAAGELCWGLSATVLQVLGHTTDTPIPLLCLVFPGTQERECIGGLEELMELSVPNHDVLKMVVFSTTDEARTREWPLLERLGVATILIDPNSKWIANVGIGTGGLILIQPDGMIGFSGSVSESDKLIALLAQRFRIGTLGRPGIAKAMTQDAQGRGARNA